MQSYFITWRDTQIGHEAELYMCVLRINKRLKAFWLVGPALAHVAGPPQGKVSFPS